MLGVPTGHRLRSCGDNRPGDLASCAGGDLRLPTEFSAGETQAKDGPSQPPIAAGVPPPRYFEVSASLSPLLLGWAGLGLGWGWLGWDAERACSHGYQLT